MKSIFKPNMIPKYLKTFADVWCAVGFILIALYLLLFVVMIDGADVITSQQVTTAQSVTRNSIGIVVVFVYTLSAIVCAVVHFISCVAIYGFGLIIEYLADMKAHTEEQTQIMLKQARILYDGNKKN